LFHLIKNHYKFLQLYQHDFNNFKEKYRYFDRLLVFNFSSFAWTSLFTRRSAQISFPSYQKFEVTVYAIVLRTPTTPIQ